MKAIKGIKKAAGESKRFNAWAIIYNAKNNDVICMELITSNDYPTIAEGDIVIMKSSLYRSSATMAEIEAAINETL